MNNESKIMAFVVAVLASITLLAIAITGMKENNNLVFQCTQDATAQEQFNCSRIR